VVGVDAFNDTLQSTFPSYIQTTIIAPYYSTTLRGAAYGRH